MIERCTSVEHPGWLELREQLWPHCSRDEHLTEMASFIAASERYAQFVARTAAGVAVGFAEASVRSDFVNGTAGSPVAFLEGLYVTTECRRQGYAKALVSAVATWVQAQGLAELASDAPIDNHLSHAVHRALGFAETERVVFFRMAVPDDAQLFVVPDLGQPASPLGGRR